jgi:hypothetical protein
MDEFWWGFLEGERETVATVIGRQETRAMVVTMSGKVANEGWVSNGGRNGGRNGRF